VTRPVQPGPPRARDPYGIAPIGTWLAPGLSVIGLVLVAVLTLNLLNGEVPFGVGGGPDDGDDGGPARTAAPSGVVVVPDEAAFEGSIVYAKGGNIWIQTDEAARQLTDSGNDSMPGWSPDGVWIYYIQTVREEGRWPVGGGVVEDYALDVPRLMRVRADGSAEPEALKSGRIERDGLRYAYWIRQPAVAPDGQTVAVISDAPNPDQGTLVLQSYSLADDVITSFELPTEGVLGHQDPAWRPDGAFLLYVRNDREGSRGRPVIMRLNMESRRARPLTAGGYLYPNYSPDGRYVAATRTSTSGTDVVILDGDSGEELLRVTSDGDSWGPVWSPAGDGIAFLHISGQVVDLRLATLEGTGPAWTVGEVTNLTEVSGLEAASRPDWFIPQEDLPATPPPSQPPSGSPAGSGGASPSP
jgi:Tol biopolymer transport system component